MASYSQNPYKRYKKLAKGRKLSGEEVHEMMKRKGSIKLTGSFHGKSNKLGHGGRAAQLKARGVPGGVIGNLARAAGAAKGQPNYHGKKRSVKRKMSKKEPTVGFKDIEKKKSKKQKGTIGFSDIERKSSKKRKGYEGSKLDRKLDRITGYKEGSKKDEEMDKVIAPHIKKGAKHRKSSKKG